MIQIIGKQLTQVVLFMLVLTFVSFLFIRLAPGDPVLAMLRVDDISVTKEQLEAMREELGFNQPLLVQYGQWFTDFLRLDFGASYISGQPVMQMIAAALPATLELAFGSLVVMVIISTTLGSLGAIYRDTWIDWASRFFSIIGAAVPSFWLAFLLIDLFAVRIGWFPPMGRNGFLSAVLPSVTLGLAMSGVYVRLIRSSLIETLNSEYVRAGRARGLSEFRLFFCYAFRRSLQPVITVFGVSLGSLIGGVVVIEVIFAYPGIGKLIVDSIRQRDYPVIQGYILVMAAVVFSVNSLIDILCRLINPELKLEERNK